MTVPPYFQMLGCLDLIGKSKGQWFPPDFHSCPQTTTQDFEALGPQPLKYMV